MKHSREWSGLALAALAVAAGSPAVARAERRTSEGEGGRLDAARNAVNGDAPYQPARSWGPSPTPADAPVPTAASPSRYFERSRDRDWSCEANFPPPCGVRATSPVQYPWSFRRYPYEAKLAGHLWLDGHPVLSPPPDSPGAAARQRVISLQLAVEESYDFAGVHRPTASVRLETKWLFGLEGTWTHFVEQRAGELDHFGIGSFNLLLHARWNRVTLWSGLGVRVLVDPNQLDGGSGAALGWNGAVGLRLLPVRPLIFDTRLEYGSLGQATVLHARGELGAIWHGVEPYAGYDYFSIGAVSFHGPLIGLRYWTG